MEQKLDGPVGGGVRFPFLDALRGLAATWVVLNHVTNYTPILQDRLNVHVYRWVYDLGRVGPTVFFLVSGYVMAHALRNAGRTTRDARIFVARRWARLSPPYYASIALAVVVSTVAARVKDESYTPPGLSDLVVHALYLPDLLQRNMVNGVHWTLYLEVQFYLVLWILVQAHRWLRENWMPGAHLLLGVVMAGSLTYPLLGLLHNRENWFGPYIYTFLAGVLLYWGRTSLVPRWVPLSFVGLLGVAWVVQKDVLAGATFITGLIVLAAERTRGLERWGDGRVLTTLGAISFSVYLTHSPIMGVANWAGVKVLGETFSAEIIMTPVYVVASLAAGWVVWWCCERPAIEWSRRIGRRQVPAKAVNPATVAA